MMQLTLFDMPQEHPTPRKNRFHPIELSERQQLQILIATHKSLSKIADLMGRGRNSIIVEVRRNGGRDTYNAAHAQKQADLRVLEKNKKTGETLKKLNLPLRSNAALWEELKQQRTEIENLKMQLEILIDTIKQMKGAYDTKD
jgi:IS30 family transposase